MSRQRICSVAVTMAGLALACTLTGCASVGRIYYVSPIGSDSGPGTMAAPLRSIGKAAELLRPGDTCFVEPGIYRETVRPGMSGSPGQPIRYVAATSGEVVVTGSEPVTNWERHKGQLYRAKVGRKIDQLFVNGSMLTMARAPNAGVAPFEPRTFKAAIDGVKVVVDGLESKVVNEWRGGRIWALGGAGCVAGTARIAGQTNNVLLLAGSPPLHRKGRAKVYLEGMAAGLDRDWEWYVEDGYVYLRLPQDVKPVTIEAEASRRLWGFDLSARSHVMVSGFRVLAAAVNMDGASHCVVDRCRFRWPGFRRDIRGGFNRDPDMTILSEGLGLVMSGHDNAIRNSVVAYCMGDGISVWGVSNVVENCVVHDCNLSASDCAPVTATGIGHHILGCTIYNAGRSGLLHRRLKRGRIEGNHIHHVGLMTSDLGGTYTYWTDGAGTVLTRNRIHDVHCPGYGGSGIYCHTCWASCPHGCIGDDTLLSIRRMAAYHERSAQ